MTLYIIYKRQALIIVPLTMEQQLGRHHHEEEEGLNIDPTTFDPKIDVVTAASFPKMHALYNRSSNTLYQRFSNEISFDRMQAHYREYLYLIAK